MTEKKNTTKKVVKKRGISICLGCVEEFKNIDLKIVLLKDKLGMEFQSVFCEKCIKKDHSHYEKFEVLRPAALPRKKRVTKPKATATKAKTKTTKVKTPKK